MADRDDAPETRPVPPPMIGSYRLIEPLGSGGMSSVFRAKHRETGHEVAVKVLPRYLAKNATLLQRFLREAKSAESLEDPNIVAIYDRGSEGGRHYLVLEYVPGGDLHDLVREHGPMPIAEAVDAVRQVANGLKHAAGRGLIHRDIKPANILRRPDGVVKVTDLGLALHMEQEEDQRVTRDGTTVGTVDYMAPEQARDSRATSVRSDIYSLGCTFFFLLTGAPPYAGGDVAEKLKAHATEPPPDARDLRPDTPKLLAKLIRKMMAKRPEKRFIDYDALLEALDGVSATLAALAAGPAKPEPLMALIDDEEEENESGALPVMALFDDDPGPSKPGPLMALIDEDDDSGDSDEIGFDLGPGMSRESGSTRSTPTMPTLGGLGPRRLDGGSLADVDFTGLEGLEEESPSLPAPIRPPSSSTGVRPPSGPRPGSAPAFAPGPAPEDAYDLAPVIEPHAHLYEVRPPSEPGVPVTVWLIRLVLAGVVLLAAVFSWTTFSPYLFRPGIEESDDTQRNPSAADGKENRPAGPRWVEPEDSTPAIAAEAAVPADALARLGMTEAAAEALARDEAPFVTVRRVDPARDRDNVGELSRAFDNLGGTAKLADDGPFFEEGLRFAGPVRVIRAAPGYRPVVVIGGPGTDLARKRPAAVMLDGQSLFVEGIDFVVDGPSLTEAQVALFQLRNKSSLTLRDCTVTVAGPIKHPYAVVHVDDRAVTPSGQASTVRIERTRLRGDASAVRLGGAAKVAIARSAVVMARGPILECLGSPRSERSVAFFRSILVSRGSAVELTGGIRPSIRSFESTFAAIHGEAPAPFVSFAGGEAAAVDWKGESDVFAGWGGWSAGSSGGLLAALRAGDPESERSSREAREGWPKEAADPWASALVPEVAAKNVAMLPPKVASPAKSLRERTLARFAPPPIPKPQPEGLVLKFNADDEAYSGDLGKFLLAHAKGAAKSVKVAVSGSGRHDMTPVAMPEGVSLEIDVAPVARNSPPLIWTTPDGATGDSLLSVHGGDLTIRGARFTSTPKTPLPVLIQVDQGSLSVSNSILIGPFGEDSAGGRLVDFRTEGTRPTRGGRASFALQDCVFLTGGDAITLEVGAVAASVTNCAIASGATAMILAPEKVRRDKFEADLTLARCTVAATENLFWLKGWSGLAPGPDRPWVLRSSGCMFTDAFKRPSQARSVLLRSQVEGLAKGVLAWESSHDVYDLTLFTAGGDVKPLPLARADLRRSWVDFWGTHHVEAPAGIMANGDPSARFLIDRLDPVGMEPGDLALDPLYPAGRQALDVGADLGRMGIAPTVPKFRPR